MKTIVIRLENKQVLFDEVPMYDKSDVTLTCIVKTQDSNGKVIWRFDDIPTGCYFGKTFSSLKEAREFRASTKYAIEYMSKLQELRIKSDFYDRLVIERNEYLERKRK